MQDYTIAETFELPSKGKIYNGNVSSEVTLRSMTTEEEMQRLAPTETPHKTICDIIDKCIVEPIGISTYDMHLGDYQFLLHRLRIVTYGNEYPSTSICPVCGNLNKSILNLDEIEIFSPKENYNELFNITLPKTHKNITLKFQTPRDLDMIAKEVKDYKKQYPDASNLNLDYMFSLIHLIDSIDGNKVNNLMLEQFVRKLPLADTNFLSHKAEKLNKVGINNIIKNKCSNSSCGANYHTTFRITDEFFGPAIND